MILNFDKEKIFNYSILRMKIFWILLENIVLIFFVEWN